MAVEFGAVNFSSAEYRLGNLRDPVYKCTMDCVRIPCWIEGELFFSNHHESKFNSDVEWLHIMDSRVPDFGVLQRTFEYVKYLTIDSCSLTSDDLADLGNFENLRSLKIINNLVKFRVTEDLFIPQDLIHLAIRYSDIDEITAGFLEKLKTSNVSSVDFRNNKKFDIMFDAESSKCHRSLEYFSDKVLSLPSVSSSFLIKANQSLWDSGELSDFIIKCGAKEFKVHKFILAANSVFFLKMFGHEVVETREGMMTITDFNEITVEEFLLFLYIHKTPSIKNLPDLFGIASKYDVKELRNYCEVQICRNINDDNATDLLRVAQLYDSSKIMEKAFFQVASMLKKANQESNSKEDHQETEKAGGIREKIKSILKP